MSALLDKIKASSKQIKESLLDEKKEFDFISTGCLPLNILFSGKLDGGIPIGKVSTIASPSSLGKSFVGLKVAKNAQVDHDMDVFYIDTEFAYDPAFGRNIGVDTDRFLPIQSNRIEDVQQIIASSIIDLPKEEKKKLILVIDSWGGLVTSKTVNDAVSGKDVTDMTIAKKKNALARLLTGLGITAFVVNQTYECQSGSTKIMMENGEKMLQDISVGEMVMTTEGLQEVLKTVEYENAIVYDIELEDGSMLTATENHKFVVEEYKDGICETKWVGVSEIFEGMDIKIINNHISP